MEKVVTSLFIITNSVWEEVLWLQWRDLIGGALPSFQEQKVRRPNAVQWQSFYLVCCWLWIVV